MSFTTGILIGLALGISLGGAVVWTFLRNRSAASVVPPDDRLAEVLRQQLAQRETELTSERQKNGQLSSLHATAEAQRASAESRLLELRQSHEKALAEARSSQERALADLKDTFKALSMDALKQTQPEFLQLAKETLASFQETAKGDLAQRQQAIATLVEPLRTQLESYQQRLQQSDSNQSAALGEVKKQLESLSTQSQTLSSETLQLRQVLSSNQARGKWGEETLRRVVEASGMSAHCDFSEQIQSGDNRPDLIVKLPGDRFIIVDAKVPDLDFLGNLDQADTTKRAEALANHAAKLKDTIKQLAARDYPSQFPNALDYVVLFLPAESLFSAALEGDHDLIVWAASKRILLATPASLIALLRSVSVSWQQHSQSENARHIASAAQELFARVSKFIDHFQKIRDSLDKAGSAYNDAVGSYERMVRPQGEKLLKMGVGTANIELSEIAPVQATLRSPPTSKT